MKRLNVHVEMENGAVHETVTRAVDYIAYESEAKKRGWGTLSDNPSSWEAFIAYRALLRERLISMPFGNPDLPQPGTFLADAVMIECSSQKADENGEAADLAYPKDQPADSLSS